MRFEIVGEIEQVETIAIGSGVRFGHFFGKSTDVAGGVSGRASRVFVCPMANCGRSSYIGYEAHGVGKRDFKIKQYLDKS